MCRRAVWRRRRGGKPERERAGGSLPARPRQVPSAHSSRSTALPREQPLLILCIASLAQGYLIRWLT